jgi:hypothetical protein
MASAQTMANERFAELVISTFSSPEPEQRGRKRRRSPPPYLTVSARQLSGESSTCRGRSRYRSTSRFDGSRATSRLRGGSLSPTRRRLLRYVKVNRHRSQSPSRSRSLNTQEPPKRRRQRTKSRSREHTDSSKPLDPISLLRHEIVIRPESVDDKQNG